MNIHLRRRVTRLACAFAGLSAASAVAQPRMPTHVACVGDSITAGTGASSTATNYPSDLQGLFGSTVQVKNFGRSSATMLTAGNVPYVKQAEYTNATTFVSNAGAGAIVDVIIMLGTNDSKPVNWNASGGGTQSQQFATDCAALVDHFAGLSTHPAIYLALPLAAYTNTYTISGTVIKNEIIPVLKQVAAQKGIATIDLQTPTAGHTEYFTDGVHPNDAGYRLVAQTMHDGLLRVPQVGITTPLTGASLAGPPVTVSATASGGTVAITSVQFFQGATSIGTSVAAPFTTSWTNAAPGAYTLTAKATDKTGAAATSAPIDITVAAGGNTGTAGGGGTSGPSSDGGGNAGAAGADGAGGSGGATDADGGGTVTGAGGATGAAGAMGSSGATGAGGASGAGNTTGAGGTTGTGGTPGATGGVAGSAGQSGGVGGSGDASSGCGACSLGRGGPEAAGSGALFALGAVLALRRKRRRSDESDLGGH